MKREIPQSLPEHAANMATTAMRKHAETQARIAALSKNDYRKPEITTGVRFSRNANSYQCAIKLQISQQELDVLNIEMVNQGILLKGKNPFGRLFRKAIMHYLSDPTKENVDALLERCRQRGWEPTSHVSPWKKPLILELHIQRLEHEPAVLLFETAQQAGLPARDIIRALISEFSEPSRIRTLYSFSPRQIIPVVIKNQKNGSTYGASLFGTSGNYPRGFFQPGCVASRDAEGLPTVVARIHQARDRVWEKAHSNRSTDRRRQVGDIPGDSEGAEE